MLPVVFRLLNALAGDEESLSVGWMNSGKHRRQLRTKTHVTLSLRRGEIARRRSSAAARSLFIRYHLSSYRLIVFQPFKGGDSPPSRFFLRQGCTLRGAGGQGGCNLSSYLPISLFSIVLSTLLLVACGRERERLVRCL